MLKSFIIGGLTTVSRKILSSSGWSKMEVARELKRPIHGFPKEGNSMSWRWPVQWRLAGPGLD